MKNTAMNDNWKPMSNRLCGEKRRMVKAATKSVLSVYDERLDALAKMMRVNIIATRRMEVGMPTKNAKNQTKVILISFDKLAFTLDRMMLSMPSRILICRPESARICEMPAAE